MEYAVDSAQRAILMLDVLRRRANQFHEHAKRGKPPVLTFAYDVVMDGKNLERPCNYLLMRIRPDPGIQTDPRKRPFVIIDPRAGHGPGISGFKPDSQIGYALRSGHPCYFIAFRPEPVPGQTLEDVGLAEASFIDKVSRLHPEATGKPCVIGNCQAGWALMALSAVVPDLMGPLIIAGSPLSYWAGVKGQGPMRYSAGLLGGTWMTALASDLGHGRFDGVHLVSNFEQLDPANTYWTKPYNLYSKIDTEEERYLEFEKWFSGFYLLNADEIQAITDSLFVGNKLTSSQMFTRSGYHVDLRNIRSPILVFASYGDNITPPAQALGWILDLYSSVDDIRSREQTIIYNLHHDIGHLGIFVSSRVARKETAEFIENIDLIELLPPGLYELIIEPKAKDAPDTGLAGDGYVTHFSPRTLDDIRRLAESRAEDEMCFATVSRVSEINLGLYKTFASPVLGRMVDERLAEWLRILHPARLMNYWLSDLNPYMQAVSGLAETVRQSRRPVAEDNAFLTLQNAVSDNIIRTLDLWRDWRDAGYEALFRGIYGSPLLQALVGLRAPHARPPRLSETRDEIYAALVQKRMEKIKALVDVGGLPEALYRVLAFLGKDTGAADERIYRTMTAMREARPEAERLSRDRIRSIIHDQALLMQLDEGGAIRCLPRLLPSKDQRRFVINTARRILSASGPLGDAQRSRLKYLLDLLDLGADETIAPTPPLAQAASPA